MSWQRLRQYCGEFGCAGWGKLSVLVVAAALSLTSAKAHAQSVGSSTAPWVGESGVASVYSAKYQGRRTAMGTRFDQRKLTAAHSWLPLGSKVKVTMVATGRSVIVTITDRLIARHCVIDLSTAAARLLGMSTNGLARVSLAPG